MAGGPVVVGVVVVVDGAVVGGAVVVGAVGVPLMDNIVGNWRCVGRSVDCGGRSGHFQRVVEVARGGAVVLDGVVGEVVVGGKAVV